MATINNLFIDQGTTYSAIIQVFDNAGLPVDLNNYTPSAQIRKSYASANAAATFTATIADSANGKIALALTADETGNLKYGRYVYDVKVTSATVVYRASEGIVTVYPRVTS